MHEIRQKFAISLVTLLCITSFSIASVGAQDSTPVDATECAVTTPEENVALVEDFTAAQESGDADAIDRLLADDLIYELERYGLENDDQTNDDEVALALALEQFYPGSVTETEETVASGNLVAAHQVLTIVEHNITGETVTLDEPLKVDMMVIYEIECGEIAHIHGVVDELELLTGLGIIAPIGGEATPAP